MNYQQAAEQWQQLFGDVPSRVSRSLTAAAPDLYDYAVMHDNLPDDFRAVLDGLAEAVGGII